MRERAVEAGGEREALERVPLLRLVEGVARARGALRLEDGGVRVAEQLVGVLGVAGKEADAHAGAEVELGGGDLERLRDRVRRPARRGHRVPVAVGGEVGEEEEEYVAPGVG